MDLGPRWGCSPKEHDDRPDYVKGGGLPEKEGEFEDNVCDVNYCQKLIISISSQIQVV